MSKAMIVHRHDGVEIHIPEHYQPTQFTNALRDLMKGYGVANSERIVPQEVDEVPTGYTHRSKLDVAIMTEYDWCYGKSPVFIMKSDMGNVYGHLLDCWKEDKRFNFNDAYAVLKFVKYVPDDGKPTVFTYALRTASEEAARFISKMEKDYDYVIVSFITYTVGGHFKLLGGYIAITEERAMTMVYTIVGQTMVKNMIWWKKQRDVPFFPSRKASISLFYEHDPVNTNHRDTTALWIAFNSLSRDPFDGFLPVILNNVVSSFEPFEGGQWTHCIGLLYPHTNPLKDPLAMADILFYKNGVDQHPYHD